MTASAPSIHRTTPRTRSRAARRPTIVLIGALAGTLALTSNALAGGTSFQSVQNGFWSNGSTWDLGVPPDTNPGTTARIQHNIDVMAPGAEVSSIVVGNSDEGRLFVGSGSLLDTNFMTVGGLGDGRVQVSDGALEVDELNIGPGDSKGHVDLFGNASLVVGDLNIAGNAFEPQSRVSSLRLALGATGVVTGDTYVGENGTLEFTPSGPAALGHVDLSVGNILFEPGSTLYVSPAYFAQPGDSFDFVVASGAATGTPALEVN